MTLAARFENAISESIELKRLFAAEQGAKVAAAARMLAGTLQGGGKVLLFGNGGSAADAQHIATELVGHFKIARKPLPALSLTTDTSLLTALANDDGYETVFSRQIEGLGDKGDVFLAITTSGNSPSILSAAKTAQQKGINVIALTGKTGGKVKNIADLCVKVPSNNTQRIQEAHITIGHILCLLIEKGLF